MATTLFSLPHDALLRALSDTSANLPWPTCDERAAWESIAQTPHGASIKNVALKAADEHVQTPGVRAPTLTEFLAYTRTGDRRTWETAAGALSARLDAFVFAACFTGEPAWIDKTADALWAMCELSSWVTPAHEGKAVPEIDNPTVDLWSAMRAQEIAELLQVVGPALDRIDPRIAGRARAEIDRRVFAPFLARSDWRWLWKQPDRDRLNNWTAVCAGGVLCAALAALNHDPVRQARVVEKAAWSLGFFKDTFDESGSLDEGAGYWAYGMSYFVMAAERLAARTAGQMDLLADPLWRSVAQFPLRVRLYGDTFVNFSDCADTVRTPPGWLAWLGRKLDVPGLIAWADRLAGEGNTGFGTHHRHLPYVLRTLWWLPSNPPSSPPRPPSLGGEDSAEQDAGAGQSNDPRQTHSSPPNVGGRGGRLGDARETAGAQNAVFLPDVQWLIARSDAGEDALILAAKGGHNAENHNHNDGGSFVVHFRQQALIAELGSPTYTRQFFSATRYDNIAARSLGHSVPFVSGQEQQAGRQFAAVVLSQADGTLSLDLAGLYPPSAGLVSLRRDLALAGNRVTLSDQAVFAGGDKATLALPLISCDTVVEVIEPGRARIAGKRGRLDLTWDPQQATCRAEEIATDDPKFVDESSGRTRLRRLWFDVAVNRGEARLDLVMTPEEVA